MRKIIKSIIPPMVTPFNDRERIEKNGHPGYGVVSITANVR